MVPTSKAVALVNGREPDKVIAEFVPEHCVRNQEQLDHFIAAMQGRVDCESCEMKDNCD